MAGSLSLSGDVTLGSDGTDTITINGATSAASMLFVLGVNALNRATSMTDTVGSRQRGNRHRVVLGSVIT